MISLHCVLNFCLIFNQVQSKFVNKLQILIRAKEAIDLNRLYNQGHPGTTYSMDYRWGIIDTRYNYGLKNGELDTSLPYRKLMAMRTFLLN